MDAENIKKINSRLEQTFIFTALILILISIVLVGEYSITNQITNRGSIVRGLA